jgi:hypothetical protein
MLKLRDTNQTITKLDEDTVVIENDFGAKAISMDRLIEITWPGDEILPLAEVIRNVNNEIGGAA